MKVTLDLDRLLEEHRITQEESVRLEALAAHETASLALNVLIAFGVIAVAGATILLLKSASVAGLSVSVPPVPAQLTAATKNAPTMICFMTAPSPSLATF